MSIIMGMVNKMPDVVLATEEESYEFKFSKINEIGNEQEKVIDNDDGFIHAKTSDNYNMAIACNKKKLRPSGLNLKSDAYIITTGNIQPNQLSGFEGIAFVGGSLNNITWNNTLDIDMESDRIIVKKNENGLTDAIHINSEKVGVKLESGISIKNGQEGGSIHSNAYELSLLFDKEKPLRDIFNHYNKVKDFLSFLTYRKNVGFDEIYLLRKSDKFDGYDKIAKVHIQGNVNSLSKSYFSNLTIDDVKPVFGKILQIMYAQDREEGYLNLGFIPEDDYNAMIMTDNKLRDICTAIESELNYANDINVEKNTELEELISIVKNEVKEYKKHHNILEEGTYSSILSSLSRWDISLKERIVALCKKYEEEISIMNMAPYIITEDKIKNVVKYRNAVTHGRSETLTSEVATTAHILAGVVYCCVLERIGVDRDRIKGLCRNKLLR